MELILERTLDAGQAGPRLAARGSLLASASDRLFSAWRDGEQIAGLVSPVALRGRVSFLSDGRVGWGPVAFELSAGLPDPLPDRAVAAVHDLGPTVGRYELIASAIAEDAAEIAVAVQYRPPRGDLEEDGGDLPQSRLVLLDIDGSPRSWLADDCQPATAAALDFGSRFFACAHMATVRAWERSSKREVARLETGSFHAVRALAFGPGGDRLAAITASGQLVAWSTSSWERVATWQAHDGRADTVAWAPGGEQVVTGGAAGLRLWSGAGDLLAAYEGDSIEEVRFASNDTLIVARGPRDYGVEVLRLAS